MSRFPSLMDEYQRGFRPLPYPLAIEDDPWYRLTKRAEEDDRALDAVHHFLLGKLSRAAGMEFLNADDKFYRDSKAQAFLVADESGITGTTTDKMLSAGARTALTANYFYPTKRVKVEYFFRYTTGTTPGNIGVEVYYGTTDAGGTLLASSGAVALVGTKTNITCRAEAYGHCRLLGTSGSLFAFAQLSTDPASGVLTNNFLLVPAATAAVTTIDTTTAQGFNIQLKNSGANASSWTVHEMLFEALN